MRKKEKLLLEYSVTDVGKDEVFSFVEIGFIVFIFIVVLLLLYPKGMLKNQVLQESGNYDLTALYLKNMLRIEPENRKLILATARLTLKEEKLDLAEELIKKFKNSNNKDILREILPMEFEYLKIKEKRTKSKKALKEIKQRMLKTLIEIRDRGFYDANSAKKFYFEALNLKKKDLALDFLEPMIKNNDIDSLQQCVYISSDIGDKRREIECLKKLTIIEKEFPKKWILALYSIYTKDKRFEDAYPLAKRLSSIDEKFQEEPARVKLLSKDFRGASKEYMELFNRDIMVDEKIDYLFRASSALQTGGFKKEAVELVKRHQDSLLNSSENIKKFIEFYLSVGSLESARELAKRVLNIELQK
jgi:hypothetical protein